MIKRKSKSQLLREISNEAKMKKIRKQENEKKNKINANCKKNFYFKSSKKK